jgi:RimJ/RimL family protein N-acetyltransferase
MAGWDGSVVLETSRLVLRTYREADLEPFAALNADPEVYRTLGDEPLSRDHSDEIAAWAQDVHESEGIGLLAVERRVDGAFVGMCGLHHQESFPDEVEVAWRLARAHWGQGYATEAATAWLDHGFDALGLPQVISTTDRDNDRSLAVMRRLGMEFRYATRMVDDGQTFDAVVYAVTAQRWRARRAAAPGERSPA